jgi:hypothetical protein
MGSQVGALFGGIWGDPGQNFVDLQGGPDKVFGKKPRVAPFVETNLSDEIGRTTQANLDNAGNINELLNRMIPGFSDLVKKGLETSGQMMSGELPQDVQDQIMRSDAFQSMMGGFSGSSMARNLTARDLGLTSLDLIGKGGSAMQQWSKLAETSYDPFIIKTMEQAGTTAANNAGQRDVTQFGYNVAAAPDPGAAGTFALDTALGMQMLSFGLGAAGGAIGGAGAAAATSRGSSATAAPMANDWYANAGGAYTYDPGSGQYVRGSQPVWGGG